jgi:hypothetical protein
MKTHNPICDNVFTLFLPKSDIVLTRYLYIKDEVELALILAILNKENDEALFWAYELYYSGFYKLLFDIIWKIYYDFFASQNPTFEAYLLTKQSEYYDTTKNKNNKDDKIVSMIIQNFIIRDFNIDVFMITNICKLFEVECNYLNNIKPTFVEDISKQFKYWIDNKEYRSICTFILDSNKNTDFVCYYSVILDLFAEYDNKILTKAVKSKKLKDYIKSYNSFVNPKIILISRLLYLIAEKNNILKKKRNFYMLVQEDEITIYKTIKDDFCKSYRILQHACEYNIQNVKMLNLFHLNRYKYTNNNELTSMYYYKWIYHASFSPIWHERIKKYYGFIDYINMNVCFNNDDCLEEFYNIYGYEPDEQQLEIQNKNIGSINCNYNWFDFYKLYKNNGIIVISDDELDELNAEPLVY